MRRPWAMMAVLCGLSCAGLAAEPQLIFEDTFTSKLGDGWTWVRENPDDWRIRDDALEIRVQPGNAATVVNALVRRAPDRLRGSYAIDVTVTFLQKPIQQYEQGGITWYLDGKPGPKLVHERIDGELYIIPGRKPMPGDSVQLRVIIDGDRWTGQYRADDTHEFETVGTATLPKADEDQVSIQCYQGPADAAHWIRFDDFRIWKLSE